MSDPTPADYADARLLVDEMALTRCPKWIELHRDHLVRQLAVAAMQKRQHAEFKSAAVDELKMGEAA